MGAGTMRLMMELHARDYTGGAMNSASARTKKLARITKSEFSGMMNTVSSYRKLVGSIVTAKVLSRGYALLEQEVYNVGAAVIDTDQALTAASAKFGDVAARGTEGFEEMRDVVEDIGGSTEFFSNEASQGLDFLAMAGFDYAQSLEAIRPLTDLATASQMDLARASDIASDALGAFGLSTDASDIEKSLNRVNDVFAETVTSSNTTMETLFDTMKHAGPAVVAAGGNIEMFATLTGKLGSAGIKSTIAGTTLKNLFTRLIAPPKEASKALRKLNIDVDDGTGHMKDMITILGELNKAFEGKSEIAREQFIKDISGMRVISGMNVLLKEGEKGLRDYFNVISNSKGAAKEMADIMRQGLGVQMKVLESAFMQKGFEIFGGLMGEEDPALAIADLAQAVRDFDTGEIVEFLKTTGSIAKWVAEFLWENKEALSAFARVWMASKLASKIGTLAQMVVNFGALLAGSGGLAASAGSAATGMGAAATATATMGSRLAMVNPLVTSFLTGLAGGYEIWKAWEKSIEEQQEKDNKNIKLATSDAGYNVREQETEAAKIQRQFLDRYEDYAPWARDKELPQAFKAVAEGNMSSAELRAVLKEHGHKIGVMGSDADSVVYQAEALIGIQRRVEEYYAELARRTDLRNKIQGGGGNVVESSAEYWQGEDFGLSSATMQSNRGPSGWEQSIYDPQNDMRKIPNAPDWGSLSTSDPSRMNPRINWDPEFKINVQVNGLAPGQSATAEVSQVPSVDEASLGVPNG